MSANGSESVRQRAQFHKVQLQSSVITSSVPDATQGYPSGSSSSSQAVRSKPNKDAGGPPLANASARVTGTDLSAFSNALVEKLFNPRLRFATVAGALHDIARLNANWPEPFSRVVTWPRTLGAGDAKNNELSGMEGAIVLGPVGPQLHASPRVIVADRTQGSEWKQSMLNPQTMTFVQFAGLAPVNLHDGDTVLYFPKPQSRPVEVGGIKMDASRFLPVSVEPVHESKHSQLVDSATYTPDQLIEQNSAPSTIQVSLSRSAIQEASETTFNIATALANHYAKKSTAKTPANDGLRAVIGQMYDGPSAKALYESISKRPVEEPGDLVADSVAEGTAGSIIVRATANLSGVREVILVPPNSATGFRLMPGNGEYVRIPDVQLQKGDTVMLCTR